MPAWENRDRDNNDMSESSPVTIAFRKYLVSFDNRDSYIKSVIFSLKRVNGDNAVSWCPMTDISFSDTTAFITSPLARNMALISGMSGRSGGDAVVSGVAGNVILSPVLNASLATGIKTKAGNDGTRDCPIESILTVNCCHPLPFTGDTAVTVPWKRCVSSLKMSVGGKVGCDRRAMKYPASINIPAVAMTERRTAIPAVTIANGSARNHGDRMKVAATIPAINIIAGVSNGMWGR